MMTPKQKAAMQMALEALKFAYYEDKDYNDDCQQKVNKAREKLREALAEQPAQQQEPPSVAELLCVCGAEWEWRNRDWELVAPPASKTWVGLTRDEIMDIINRFAGQDWVYAVEAIETKLREKNA